MSPSHGFPLLFGLLMAAHTTWVPAADQQSPKIPDTIEQRMAACAGCHGKQGEGVRKNEYYPRLAGKPPQYLSNQLQNFRAGLRLSSQMTYMVKYLSDQYLKEIAEYYAALRPPYPAPTSPGSSEQALARGEALVTKGNPSKEIPACAACHGKALTGMQPAIPGLIGLTREYIAVQLGGWKSGRRKAHAPDCMAQIASRLEPADISAVATWLAAQPASVDMRPAPPSSQDLPLACGSVRQ